MPRDEQGFLKAEALINGIKEQFAIVDSEGTKHIVELSINRHGHYIVTHDFEERGLFGTVGSHTDLWGTNLAGAQQEFSKQVRALGGRA